MSIREILKQNPLVLAPMAGITDFPFRKICREQGAGLVYSEMVSVEALIRDHRRTHAMLHTDASERPVAFQIFGSKPASLAEAAAIVSHGEVDFIDINMGCPVPKVLKSGAGSALLKDLGLARGIMEAVVKASAVPVTVKIRAGWDAQSIVGPELARIAESAGIAAITVHGRTRTQGFSGHADWNIIRQVKEAVSIPVIGNGDVRSAQDAKRLLYETGCDGVMIGRACQGYPWIFREAAAFLASGAVIAGPSLSEREAVMGRHVQDMVHQVGELIGIREMRKHLCWYTKGLAAGAEFRTRINQADSLEDVMRELDRFFDLLRNRPKDAERTAPCLS